MPATMNWSATARDAHLHLSGVDAAQGETASATVTMEHAMALYDLHSFELLWEKALDTKVLLAWSDSTCVVTFRGTSSWANVLADLEVRVAWLRA